MRVYILTKATSRFKAVKTKAIDLEIAMRIVERVNRHYPEVEIWLEKEQASGMKTKGD